MSLDSVRTWIFDLDNTLYPAECRLFEQIDARMSEFVQKSLGIDAKQARRLQKEYYAEYGTTLAGLMKVNDIAPTDFLDYVHDIDVSCISENLDLVRGVSELPGQRFVFTNGSVQHAENVIDRLGISHLFDGIFDIEASGYIPKPRREAYDLFLGRHGISPDQAAMFEDIPVNLEVPFELGMQTVLVCSEADWIDDEPQAKRPARPSDTFDHVHHQITDLPDFLLTLTDQIET